MPSKSAKQRRFMAAAAHNPSFAKKAGIKQRVAREFNNADQGALKKALGGAVRKAAGKVASAAANPPSTPPAKGGGLRGALGRVIGRIAPQGQKAPQQPVKRNHMFRNAGPIKQELLSGTDNTIAETGDGLRKVVGRIASRGRVAAAKGGKIKKYAEGGKVGSAMSALQALAKRYQSALDSGDAMLARRLKRELELKKKGEGLDEEPSAERKAREDKLATFAKGGKVKAAAAAVKSQREWMRRAKDAIAREFKKSAKLKDDEPVRVRFGKDETTHVNAKGKKYSFQAGSDDDRYDFRSDDGDHVAVEFTDDMFE